MQFPTGILFKIGVVFLLCLASYFVGLQRAKTKFITKEVEVIKYVTKEKAKIYSQPNATRDELIQLLKSNKL